MLIGGIIGGLLVFLIILGCCIYFFVLKKKGILFMQKYLNIWQYICVNIYFRYIDDEDEDFSTEATQSTGELIIIYFFFIENKI